MVESWSQQRAEMLRFQLKSRGIVDPRVLSAMAQVPRHLFVPRAFQAESYQDHPLPIGANQTISQPYIVALMSESLGLKPGAKILEIGAGCGYQSAVLLQMGYLVTALELKSELVELANTNLSQAGYGPVVQEGDGYQGWPKAAPYDGILVAAAAPVLPQALLSQLRPGGVMVIPLGELNQALYRLERTPTGYAKQRLCAVRFVPLLEP